MKYEITRASLHSDKAPCDEAIKEGELWYVTLNTLEGFMKFVKKYGEIVLYPDSIIIYDDYLE